jgi:hypothetical protein
MTRGEIEQTVRAADRYNPEVSASCQEFYRQVRSLESSVMCGYKIAVCLAKRTTDLKELCEIWRTASETCDAVLKALKSLKESHPQCGTPELYDLALDYKNAAFKRYQLNLEALQWEKTEIPAGLSPRSN